MSHAKLTLSRLESLLLTTAGIELADRQRLEIIESLSKLKMQKLGLMQDLLIGRVSVDHLIPEPVDA